MGAENQFRVLIEQMRGGSREAAELLYRRYGPHIVRIVQRRVFGRLRPKMDCEDVAQSVWRSFLAIPPERCIFQDPDALIAYLARIARNKVVDARRALLGQGKKHPRDEYSLDGSAAREKGRLQDATPRPSQVLTVEDEWDRLVRDAPPRYRQIFVRLRQGTSHQEIAAELGIAPKVLQRLLLRTLKTLRARWEGV